MLIDATVFEYRCKAFRCEPGPRVQRVSVDADGIVHVWDDVAGHFTTCHSLSQRQQARIRTRARQVQAA